MTSDPPPPDRDNVAIVLGVAWLIVAIVAGLCMLAGYVIGRYAS